MVFTELKPSYELKHDTPCQVLTLHMTTAASQNCKRNGNSARAEERAWKGTVIFFLGIKRDDILARAEIRLASWLGSG